MTVLLVTYELKTPGKDYTSFYNAIKSGGEWWHFLEAVWLVDSTTHNADTLAKSLYPHITQQDRLMVVALAGGHQGWLPEAAWTWINNRKF